MPRSCLLTAHSLAAGVRALFERIDEMRAYARVACVNLVLLRIVAVQRAQRLGLHPKLFQSVAAVVCGATAHNYQPPSPPRNPCCMYERQRPALDKSGTIRRFLNLPLQPLNQHHRNHCSRYTTHRSQHSPLPTMIRCSGANPCRLLNVSRSKAVLEDAPLARTWYH